AGTAGISSECSNKSAHTSRRWQRRGNGKARSFRQGRAGSPLRRRVRFGAGRTRNFGMACQLSLARLAVGIELKLYGQHFFGSGGSVLPLLDCFHGGLAEDRTSAEQLGALHDAVGGD